MENTTTTQTSRAAEALELISNEDWLAGYAAQVRGEGFPYGCEAGFRAGYLAARDEEENGER